MPLILLNSFYFSIEYDQQTYRVKKIHQHMRTFLADTVVSS